MKYLNWRIILVLGALLPLFLHISPLEGSAEGTEDQPTNGFEGSNGERWTTFEEEQHFLKEVAELSERVMLVQVGTSVEGRRPLNLVKIGYPNPPKEGGIVA